MPAAKGSARTLLGPISLVTTYSGGDNDITGPVVNKLAGSDLGVSGFSPLGYYFPHYVPSL